MTQKQLRLYDYIVAFTAENRMAPTYQQMRVAMGYKSRNGVHAMVDRLSEQGMLERTPNRARSVKVINQGER